MSRPISILAAFLGLLAPALVARAEVNVRDFGATPDDGTDDTKAIVAALAACAKAGGGSVYVPAGTYLVSRQGKENPVLEVPSNTTVRGDGAASVLKFDPRVNQSNFWRMIGASQTDARNVTIRDLHLDGSNEHLKYEPGMPEQDHGVFFGRQDGKIENVTVRDCLVENFGGDCVSISMGCRNVTVRDVAVRNFLRQGIQLAGDARARDYLVTGCQDLEGNVTPMVVLGLVPSPDTPGGVRVRAVAQGPSDDKDPHPRPLPAYRAREESAPPSTVSEPSDFVGRQGRGQSRARAGARV